MHRIQTRFSPRIFWFGLIVSGLAWSAVLGWLILIWRAQRRQKQAASVPSPLAVTLAQP